tara:strand:+ start:313 stop:558 length:246 start_codon:yes stop_codon:yes gene_type:complete
MNSESEPPVTGVFRSFTVVIIDGYENQYYSTDPLKYPDSAEDVASVVVGMFPGDHRVEIKGWHPDGTCSIIKEYICNGKHK